MIHRLQKVIKILIWNSDRHLQHFLIFAVVEKFALFVGIIFFKIF